MTDASAFLTQIFGSDPEGRITTSHPDPTKPRKDGEPSWISEHAATPAEAAAIAEKLAPKFDVYFGVCPRREGLTPGQRGGKDDIVALTALFADFDVIRPNHQTNGKVYFADREAVLAFADSLPLKPSLIVWSGGGAHLYWILREPWLFTDAAERDAADRQLKAWGHLLQREAKRLGVDIDMVQELARVLRVPGTFNHKTGDAVPVKVIRDSGTRFNVSDFAELAPPEPADETNRPTPPLIFNPNATVPEKIRALLSNDSRAKLTLARRRPDLKDQSDSGYSLALANIAVRAGWTDQEIVAFLVAARQHWKATPKPASWYALTIAKARASTSTVQDGTPAAERPGKQGSSTQAEQLVALAADFELWHTRDFEAFATVAFENGHRENWPVESKEIRDLLRKRFYDARQKVPSKQALADAGALISGKAAFSGECHEAPIRIAEVDGHVYIDLCDLRWQAIKVTSQGWEIVASIALPVKFRRAPGMKPLPLPVKGGSVEALRPFIHGEPDVFILVVGWLVGALNPSGPYLSMIFLGPAGSGKSLCARLLRSLIDPNTALLRSVPREERDLAIATRNGYVVAIDNVSSLPAWLSDALAKLSTSGGFATRKNYTDSDEILFDRCAPILLTGISGVATRADLLDRSELVPLPSIPKGERRTERDLLTAFDEAAPSILGGLLDAVSAALANRDKMTVQLPRMADACSWIIAAESALPWQPGAFLAAYERNEVEAASITLDADSLSEPLIRFMSSNSRGWTGTVTSLLETLTSLLSAQRPLDWPRSPHELSSRLTRLAPAFRAYGIEIHRRGGHHTGRTLTIENKTGGVSS